MTDRQPKKLWSKKLTCSSILTTWTIFNPWLFTMQLLEYVFSSAQDFEYQCLSFLRTHFLKLGSRVGHFTCIAVMFSLAAVFCRLPGALFPMIAVIHVNHTFMTHDLSHWACSAVTAPPSPVYKADVPRLMCRTWQNLGWWHDRYFHKWSASVSTLSDTWRLFPQLLMLSWETNAA